MSMSNNVVEARIYGSIRKSEFAIISKEARKKLNLDNKPNCKVEVNGKNFILDLLEMPSYILDTEIELILSSDNFSLVKSTIHNTPFFNGDKLKIRILEQQRYISL